MPRLPIYAYHMMLCRYNTRRRYQPLHVYTQVGNAAEVLNSRKAVLAEKELMLENVLEEEEAKVPPCLPPFMHRDSSTFHICMHAKYMCNQGS